MTLNDPNIQKRLHQVCESVVGTPSNKVLANKLYDTYNIPPHSAGKQTFKTSKTSPTSVQTNYHSMHCLQTWLEEVCECVCVSEPNDHLLQTRRQQTKCFLFSPAVAELCRETSALNPSASSIRLREFAVLLVCALECLHYLSARRLRQTHPFHPPRKFMAPVGLGRKVGSRSAGCAVDTSAAHFVLDIPSFPALSSAAFVISTLKGFMGGEGGGVLIQAGVGSKLLLCSPLPAIFLSVLGKAITLTSLAFDHFFFFFSL